MSKKLTAFVGAILLTLGLSSVALAGSVKVGGALRFELSYLGEDSNSSSTGNSIIALDIFHMSTSNLNFTYQSADKKYEAYAEIGLLSNTQGNNVYTRRTWFRYNWNGGSILFGQTGSLEESYFPASVLRGTAGILGFGKDWWNRPEQIRLTLGTKYKFKFALESPTHTGNFDVNGDGVDDGISSRYLPAVAAALDMSFGRVNVYPWFRWEMERLTKVSDGSTVDWHSLDLGLELAGDFGLIGFTVGVGYGINSTGTNPVAGPALPVFDSTFEHRADHKQFRVFGDLKIGNLHLGGGYAHASRDDLNGVAQWTGNPHTAAVYANYWIGFGSITFVPELAWYDFGEDTSGADLGNGIRVGLYTTLVF